MRDEDWPGYNIDVFPDGSSVCQIDSVGSQANRMEPLFKKQGYADLVPQIVVRLEDSGSSEVNLLDAGHRAADAIVRFSGLASELETAFRTVKDQGNAEPLARIAPTSLVFGAWDSRVTQVKLARIVRSVIRAFDVKPLHRSAQYIPPAEYTDKGVLDAPEGKAQQDALSQLGLSHAPAPWTHGGILAAGGIRRDATLNLVALRTVSAESPDRTLALRRYVLGLSLVSLTARQDNFLREGCQLVPNREKQAKWSLLRYDGHSEDVAVTHDEAIAYARLAATGFGVGKHRETSFDGAGARDAVGQSKEERKKARRAKAKVYEPEAGA
jgi:CRISPR-associated protein Csb1